MVDATDVPRIASNGLFMELPDDVAPWPDMFQQMKDSPFARVGGKLYAVPEKFGYYGACFNKKNVDVADAKRGDILVERQIQRQDRRLRLLLSRSFN